MCIKGYIRACLLCIFQIAVLSSYSQDKQKKRVFRDSLDNKVDFSDFLSNPSGFIPLIQPITEPALGGIGAAITPVFIKPNKHPEKDRYTPPNVTTLLAAYTANNSFLVGGFRMGYVPKYKFKYTAALGYGSVNLDFYRTLPIVGEKKFGFNFSSYAFGGSILKQVKHSNFYVGFEYLFVKNNIDPTFEFDKLPSFVKEKDFSSIISSPGVIVEYDHRDNVFTPDRGFYMNTNFHLNGTWTGSDYNFQNLEIIALKYISVTSRWISGFRVHADMQFGDSPFYAKPGVQLRGVPMARYQGENTFVFESEQRYDFTKRWSGVAFGGLAKAIEENTNFKDASLIYSYGTGIRYLIARKFKIRMGLDVAWSNNDFGYYIVFGSAWNQRN